MELAKGGELFDKLLEQGCLVEQEAATIMSQVQPTLNDDNALHLTKFRFWKQFMIFIHAELFTEI